MVLIRWALMLVHLAVCVLLFATFLNAYVSPKTFGYLNLLSLSFPILLILHLLLTLLWLLRFKKRGVVFLLLTILLIGPTRRIVNYSFQENSPGSIKVITYNSKNGQNGEGGSRSVQEFIESEDPDVVLLQEDRTSLPEENAVKEGVSQIYSKHKILNSGSLITDGSNAHAHYADLEIGGKTLRVINVYLKPFQLQKSMVRPTSDADINKEKAKKLIFRLVPTFKAHQSQVQQIRAAIDNSPYPVILGGDFNSVPNSWEYYHLIEGLEDSFVEVGKGSATSFHDYKFPIRIDYLFHSKGITPKTYEVNRSVELSDHFPVIATFDF